jgi:hypothetical protein
MAILTFPTWQEMDQSPTERIDASSHETIGLRSEPSPGVIASSGSRNGNPESSSAKSHADKKTSSAENRRIARPAATQNSSMQSRDLSGIAPLTHTESVAAKVTPLALAQLRVAGSERGVTSTSSTDLDICVPFGVSASTSGEHISSAHVTTSAQVRTQDLPSAIEDGFPANSEVTQPTSTPLVRTRLSRSTDPHPEMGNAQNNGRLQRSLQPTGPFVAALPDALPAIVRLPLHNASTLTAQEANAPLRSPGPIGPIQPIGRPRPTNIAGQFDQNPDAPFNTSSTRLSSGLPKGQILGSAALSSGDDEVIIPAPRRVSHSTGVLGQTWNSGPTLTNAHWNTTFGVAPAPIWGRNNLSPATSHAWPSTTNPTPFLHPLYEPSGSVNGPSEMFMLRAPSGVGGLSTPSQIPSTR